ncbi:hypothetical protein ACFQ2Y_17785 [Streptomyces malaysiensis subsp. malaysiensis]
MELPDSEGETMAEFKVGDKVRVLSGGEGEITYGPVNSTFDRYTLFVVKQDGDKERAYQVSDLDPIVTDPRREVVARALATATVGHRAVIAADIEAEYGRADAILAALNAMEAPAEPAPWRPVTRSGSCGTVCAAPRCGTGTSLRCARCAHMGPRCSRMPLEVQTERAAGTSRCLSRAPAGSA